MNLAKLLVAIGATTTGFQRGIAAAERRVDALERRTNGLRKGFGNLTRGMGSLVGSLAGVAIKLALVGALAGGIVAGGLIASVNAAVDFERSMLNVQSIAKVTPAAFEQMKKEVLDLTRVLPQSADELAHSLYDIQSSGFAGAQGIIVLNAAAKAASAGLSTSADAAKGITAVLNAYGLAADQAGNVSDILFQVVNRGVITFPELSAEIGKTTAVAAALHVPLKQVAAGIALLTRHGIDGANATTQLNAIMNAILVPSSAAAKLSKKLGLGWNAASLKAKGLSGVMADMIKKTGGSAEKMAVLLGDSRAIRGAFVLASKGGKEFKDELLAFNDVAGVTDDVLAVQKQGLGYQLDVLKNNIMAVAISLGTALIPKLIPVVEAMSAWLAANQAVVGSIIDGIINAIGTIANVLGKYVIPAIVEVGTKVYAWIEANKPLIFQVGTTLFNAASAVATFITQTLVPALISIGTFIATNVVPKVGAFIDTLTKPGGVIDSITVVAGPVIGSLLVGFGAIVTALFGGRTGVKGRGTTRGLIPALGDLAGTLWDGGKSPLALAFKAIAWFLGEVIGPAIGKLIGQVTSFIDRINEAIHLLPDLGALATPGPQVPAGRRGGFGAQAVGGSAMKNGISLVGEKGPELVKWGGNGYVTPADLSANAMASSGGGAREGDLTLNINNPEPRAAEADIGRVMRRLEGIGLVAKKRAGAW